MITDQALATISARPTGTVTLLFTDVEGSTRLWEEHRAAMGRAIARHDGIFRATAESNGGFVFKTIGDAFCIAFQSATAAVNAAVAAQQALLAETWEEIGALRVRMAVHTGAVEDRDGDYFGVPLNRVARLLAAGHGGQILISSATEALVRGALPGELSLLDLGERRLKDLKNPQRIFQLLAPDLPAQFPTLRSLEVFPNNLPAQLTSFVGRDRELREVKELIRSAHLLTLTGPGGTGKTRLAIHVAADLLEDFPHGIWLVELATVSDPDLIPETIAAALNIRQEADAPLLGTITNFLRQKKLLLIPDNCEHLVARCADIAGALIRACPELRILATSRAALLVAGEKIYSVPALGAVRPAARSAEELAEFDSVRLFIDRAQAVKPGFSPNLEELRLVAEICWRLDGIPLAIELAAARLKVLSLSEIARRLEDRFHLLTGGSRTALPHQQTLRALIDWSYELLSPSEQMLLRRLAVFARGRSLEAVEVICSGDGVESYDVLDLLSQLVDKSLVSMEPEEDGTPRYFLLESVWDYGRAKLEESGEAKAIRDKHLAYFLKLAREAEPQLVGPDQVKWIEALEIEEINLRFAVDWSLEDESRTALGLELAAALGRFWEVRGNLKIGRDYYAELLAKPAAQSRNVARAMALFGAGRLAWCQEDNPTALRHYDEALSIYREIGNRFMTAMTLGQMAFVFRSEGNAEESVVRLEEGWPIALKLKNEQLRAIMLSGKGSIASDNGDLESARAMKEEALAVYRQFGDLWVIGLIAWSLARIVILQKDFVAGRAYLSEAVSVAQKLGNRWVIPYLLEGFASLALGEEKAERAATLFAASDALRAAMAISQSPTERTTFQNDLSQVRARLSAAEFNQAWKTGVEFSAEKALEIARL
jgi:predicted ATPase/class 3 adenylate cyclase